MPDLIIAADLNGILLETTQILLDYVRDGGQLLLTLGPGLDSQTLNSTILPELGLAAD
ncbi:MAG: hypothetical protein IIC52_11240 [Proteobacteria bacterium]|nr:hypothetical protein [Pseudomonadota bacterium]